VRSRFYLKVDLIRVGSWSIMVIDCLRPFKGKFSNEMPSIYIFPAEISVMPRSVLMIVVFPAPVRPTMPIFYPALMLHFIPLITVGKSLRYLTYTSSKIISPFFMILLGVYSSACQSKQYWTYPCSGSMAMKLYILSMETILVSKVATE
jgi:hypothetical protein